jgi:hypothetical protein
MHGLWRLLGLDQLPVTSCRGREEVPWPLVAAILVLAALCAPGSELFIEQTWYRTAAGRPAGCRSKVHTTYGCTKAWIGSCR